VKLKSLKSAMNTPSFAEHVSRRLREGILLLVGAIAVYLLIALFTYSATDIVWSGAQKNTEIFNAGGRVGAFFADILLYLLGCFAFLLPLMLFYSAWLYFRYREELDTEYFSYYLMLRTAGFIFILLPGCALARMHIHAFMHLAGGGGILGKWLAHSMVKFFNLFGANLILTALFLTGITLFTGFSWLKAADYCGEQAWRFAAYVRALLARIEHWVVNSSLKEELPAEPIVLTEAVPVKAKIKPQITRVEPKVELPLDSGIDFDVDPDEPFISVATAPPVISRAVKKAAVQRIEDEANLLFEPPLAGTLPPLSLLDAPDNSHVKGYTNQQLEEISREVELRLQDFGIQVKVVAVHPGPVVTRFELQLAAGTKVSRITALAKDLARSLSVISVRVVEIIPGKSVIGLELPNIDREIVRLREILSSELYMDAASPLTLAMGKDIAGNSVIVDLGKMPHLLVAGTTGSGKSVGLNAMLLSLLYKATPDDLRMILIDPKMLELSIYEGIPHLLTPVVTDMKDAANALRWAVVEMDRRYRLMASLGVRNLAGFNAKIKEAAANNSPIPDPFWQAAFAEEQPAYLEKLPYVVILVDEFADMMMIVGKKVEELIARIAQKARAAGIHLILATQRPSVDVITGLIKANIPTRVAFQVSSKIDSRTILDQQGAEQLLGHGDMLYLAPGTGVPVRIHGAFVADEEVHRVVRDIKRRGQPQYLPQILLGDSVEGGADLSGGDGGEGAGEQDALYDQAVQIVIETRRASISHIQRRLKIGYNRAANIVEAMEAAGVVSGMDTSGAREVLVPNNQ